MILAGDESLKGWLHANMQDTYDRGDGKDPPGSTVQIQ